MFLVPLDRFWKFVIGLSSLHVLQIIAFSHNIDWSNATIYADLSDWSIFTAVLVVDVVDAVHAQEVPDH